ncbi:MAG: hypothetical protein V8S72_03745 [Oscillospiraceae bacterium]
MLLNLREIIEIPGASVDFETELETDRLDFPAIKEYKAKPKAVGRVYNEAGILNLTGEIRADMVCVCDRCGCDFERTKLTELHATIVEENAEDDPELFLLQGDGIDWTRFCPPASFWIWTASSSVRRTARVCVLTAAKTLTSPLWVPQKK